MKPIVVYCIAFLPILTIEAKAQDLRIPQPSTLQTVQQEFGLGQITIAYCRPNVKGRKIFGTTEPYGHVWRTGANAATRFKLTDSIMIEKQMLAPGEYSFFTIPGPKEWTIIFNQTVAQWGAYSYDSTKDILRLKVKPAKVNNKLETFTIQFANTFSEHTDLQLSWENTIVTLHLETDVDARIMANIDRAMQGEKKPYYFAAIYYYNHDKDMNKALAWINEFEKALPQADNAKYWKARIQLKMGDKPAAIATANEGLKLATESGDTEYIRLNKEVLEQATK
jgi:Protein of unknown function (DUF2911)